MVDIGLSSPHKDNTSLVDNCSEHHSPECQGQTGCSHCRSLKASKGPAAVELSIHHHKEALLEHRLKEHAFCLSRWMGILGHWFSKSPKCSSCSSNAFVNVEKALAGFVNIGAKTAKRRHMLNGRITDEYWRPISFRVSQAAIKFALGRS